MTSDLDINLSCFENKTTGLLVSGACTLDIFQSSFLRHPLQATCPLKISSEFGSFTMTIFVVFIKQLKGVPLLIHFPGWPLTNDLNFQIDE